MAKKLLLALMLISSISHACILDRIESSAISTVKNNPKKTCFVAGVSAAIVGKYAMPKVIDYSKRAYNWLKSKIRG